MVIVVLYSIFRPLLKGIYLKIKHGNDKVAIYFFPIFGINFYYNISQKYYNDPLKIFKNLS